MPRSLTFRCSRDSIYLRAPRALSGRKGAIYASPPGTRGRQMRRQTARSRTFRLPGPVALAVPAKAPPPVPETPNTRSTRGGGSLRFNPRPGEKAGPFFRCANFQADSASKSRLAAPPDPRSLAQIHRLDRQVPMRFENLEATLLLLLVGFLVG